MLDNYHYKTIFKRKSFHTFKFAGDTTLTEDDFSVIRTSFSRCEPLYPDIKTNIRIVSASTLNISRQAEYCVLLYSEVEDNYLMNIGYIGEQLDLFMVEHNIGTLWYGIGKPDLETYNGLNFVIMFLIRKIDDESFFRKDMFKSKRKELKDIWQGDTLGIAEIARFAPSACNTQPWLVKNHIDRLEVYRYKKEGKRGIMPKDKVIYYNKIDMGIFLCILDICQAKKGIKTERTLFIDNGESEYTKICEYKIN